MLNEGTWQCSGEWTTEAKSARHVPISSSPKLKRSATDSSLHKVCTYENSMTAWTEARLPSLKRAPGAHHTWTRCHSQSISPGPEARVLGPDITEESFVRRSMSSTAPAALHMDVRKAHGYLEPGILRRPGAYSKIPGGFTANVDRMPREDRFMTERQPHEIEVKNGPTAREDRFIPKEVFAVDVRRSN